MPFLSVIIPVYKVEKYLGQCVESVINQNLEDIEIILVDDGSPDGCPQICDSYAEKYSFVKVIHKPNGGQSSARNVGVKVANGKYLMFVDSDDWWNSKVQVSDMLSYVKNKPQVDMFLFSCYDYVEGEGLLKRKEHAEFCNIDVSTVESYYESLLTNGNLEVAAYNKILKTEFIKINNLYFNESLVCEDNEWMIRLLRNIKCVDVIDKPLYIYRARRKGSVTGNIRKKNIVDMLWIVKEMIVYNSSDVDERWKKLEMCFAAYLWFCAMGLCTKINKEEKKEIRYLFDETSLVCKYSNSRKTKLCNYFYKIFGFRITMYILGEYIKFKGKKNLFMTKVKN